MSDRPLATLRPRLSVKAVAELYGVSVDAVYAWIKARKLAALKLPGGDFRVRPEDLDEFEQRCRDQSSPAPNTDSSSADESGALPGPTRRVVRLAPFQRGKKASGKPKSGATNG